MYSGNIILRAECSECFSPLDILEGQIEIRCPFCGLVHKVKTKIYLAPQWGGIHIKN
jgi:LSD1 subclass zinc finger protein